MDETDRPPAITQLSWGRIAVEGRPAFRDAKVYPGGARARARRETGTRHPPGIQPADVQELLDHGATTVILPKGIHERPRVCPETLERLKARGAAAEIPQTEDAVERDNQLRRSTPVGGLFRSTR